MLYRIVSALMVLLVLALAITMMRERQAPWQDYQKRYRGLLESQARTPSEAEAASRVSVAIRQVLDQELVLIDRCQTCHLGVDDPTLADAPQPFTAHPDIPRHAFDKFGCIPCHQGQPWGTDVNAAHGEVAFWEEPLLGRAYLEASCGRCHLQTEVRGAPVLSRGRRLMAELVCEECHRIGALGGTSGPDLTTVGSHYPIGYLRESITDPRANDSASLMPDFGLTKDDEQALVVALLALSNTKYPRELYPATAPAERVLRSALMPETLDVGGRLFRSLQCNYCHKAGDYGTPFASDLSGVGLSMDSDALLEYFGSESFDSAHPWRDEVMLRPKQLSFLADFLADFKSETTVPAIAAAPTTRAATPTATTAVTAAATTPQATGGAARARLAAVEVDPAEVERGKQIYRDKNCKICHKIAGSGGSLGPKLDKVGAKRDWDWLFYHFKDPESISPGSRMPDFKFSDEDARALTAYMQVLR